MLREQVVELVGREKLNRMAIFLGLFKAADWSDERLKEKFIRSRLFTDEMVLYLLTLKDLRAIAAALKLDATARKDKLVAELLAQRKLRPQKKASTIEPSKPDTPPESPPTQFNPRSVSPELFATRHLWLYNDGKYWVLSTKRGRALALLESREGGQAWHRAFDEYRGFPHHPAKEGRPPGYKGKDRTGGLSGSQGFQARAGNNLTNDDAQTGFSSNAAPEEEDSPDTLYECPVCQCGVKLRDVKSHLSLHKTRREVSSALRDYVRGLDAVARKVMARHAHKHSVSKVHGDRPKRDKRGTHESGSKRDSSRRRRPRIQVTADDGGNPDDLWVRNRPWSGGGANSTGKRR